MKLLPFILFFSFVMMFANHFIVFAKNKKAMTHLVVKLKLSTSNSDGLALSAMYSDIQLKEINSNITYRNYECTIPISYGEDEPILAIQRNGVTLRNLKNKYELSIKDIYRLMKDNKEKDIYVFILSS